jgi:hypothetical protein
MSSRFVRLGAVMGSAACVVGFAASPALAAHAVEPAMCSNGQTYIVRTLVNHSSANGGWGVGVILEGGSGVGIPTVTDAAVVDNTIGQTLFTLAGAKGGGNANHNQSTVMCTITDDGTVGDFVAPGTPLPPGASLSDSATLTLIATVVLRP